MSVLKYCINDLVELNDLLSKINAEVYTKSSVFLSNATIGQHIRHIIEFYECLLLNNQIIIDYDARKRSKTLELDNNIAQSKINFLITLITDHKTDGELSLRNNFTDSSNAVIKTSFDREIAYCLEHSIHHKALIKVVLIELQLNHLVEESFGVAPSTLKNRLHHSNKA